MSSWQSRLRKEAQRARDRGRETLALLVKLLPYSRSTADGVGDKVQGYTTEGSDEQPYDYDGRRMFPFGIRSVPPKGVQAVWLGVAGESGNGVIVAAESSRFGPSDLADGEVCLYNKVTGATIKIDKNGAVTASDPNGAQMKLDGNGAASLTDKAGNQIKADGTNIDVTAAAGANVNVSASGSGSVQVTATPVTGAVKLGPVGTLQVLVLGAQDPVFGAPILQAPAAVLSIVKAG